MYLKHDKQDKHGEKENGLYCTVVTISFQHTHMANHNNILSS